MPSDDSIPRPRRERSVRYPGVPLAEAIEFCRRMEAKGLDGLMAEAIAAGLGYGNIKTNTFSARLSAARQFGLLSLRDEIYTLTPIARGLLHPLSPADVSRLHRQALASPPLYAELIARLAGRKVPEPAALANMLYHQFQITASAKVGAAEAFLTSARFAGVLDSQGYLRPDGTDEPQPEPPSPAPTPSEPPPLPSSPPTRPAPPRSVPSSPVRIDLRLWGPDSGKIVRVRAPESMSAESFDRLLQALRLHVRIDPPHEPDNQS